MIRLTDPEGNNFYLAPHMVTGIVKHSMSMEEKTGSAAPNFPLPKSLIMVADGKGFFAMEDPDTVAFLLNTGIDLGEGPEESEVS